MPGPMVTRAPMRRLRRAGLLLALAGGLLAVAPPMAEGYNLIKLVFMYAGAALFWVGAFGEPVRATALERPLAALWLAMILSALFSVDPPAAVIGQYPQAFYGLLPHTACLALFY